MYYVLTLNRYCLKSWTILSDIFLISGFCYLLTVRQILSLIVFCIHDLKQDLSRSDRNDWPPLLIRSRLFFSIYQMWKQRELMSTAVHYVCAHYHYISAQKSLRLPAVFDYNSAHLFDRWTRVHIYHCFIKIVCIHINTATGG